MAAEVKNIGIIINLDKEISRDYIESVLEWLGNHGCTGLLQKEAADKMLYRANTCEVMTASDIYKHADVVLVFGGDGTILGNAETSAKYGKPVLGINFGHLGFLTDVEVKDTFEALDALVSGNFSVEERMMLRIEVRNRMNKKLKRKFYCLNEAGISRGTLSKMLTLQICINNEYFDTYHADGLLISTPTGSTAYSLSAGGPIINPKIKAILITPLCPHSLSARSLVVAEREEVRTEIINNYQDAYLTLDGQIGYSIQTGDTISVKKANFVMRLIKISNRSFYDVLRTKLKERIL